MAKVAVYIPKQAIMEGKNLLTILKEMKGDEIYARQLLIEKLASRWQYSMVTLPSTHTHIPNCFIT